MAKINKAEIIGTIIGVTGLSVVAASAPLIYCGPKLIELKEKEAEKPRGLVERYNNAAAVKHKLVSQYIECYRRLEEISEHPGKECEYLRTTFLAIDYANQPLDEEYETYKNTQYKLGNLEFEGMKFTWRGSALAVLGSIIFLAGAAYRKSEEQEEAEAREWEGLKPCSLDEKMYCEETDQPHLYGEKINNLVK